MIPYLRHGSPLALALFALSFLLAGCHANQPPAAAAEASLQQSAPEEHSGSLEKLNLVGAAAAAKTYIMNSNYDIVPIDPSGDKKVVLLTFDDGPNDRTLLEQMTSALAKHRAKAIFFVNGYRVQKHPELLLLLHERGHTIGNHSWDHIDLKREPEEQVIRQIRSVQQLVKETIGAAPTFFRPPFGSSGALVKKKAKEEHLLFMTWSNGSEDWLVQNQKPERVIERVLQQLHPGSNILMHELPWTAAALDDLLTKLEEKGYSFVDPASIDTANSYSPYI
ncbi:polysaccharide deacetylase family protein [Paenibacillus ginsengarvi]|uniref:Polysaccharide deacetylase family protein n=1 Tax=Paenibacillus ginsengarvi TaxID=400777 RepID=A0A3B0CKR8_9BACL|nr:polysaccharide deacetylase family protein [Paenibacillus ginsengarvi]RKN84616.1 polysaccharide deacetylase family protein [Paenibacillus ginsengarvi]